MKLFVNKTSNYKIFYLLPLMDMGGFRDIGSSQDPTTIVDYIKNKYYEKPEISDFFAFKPGFDYSFDNICQNTKKNFNRFAIYHLGIAAALYLFFILRNPIFLLPITTIIGTIYFMNNSYKYNDIEITPKQIVTACCIFNGILILLFGSYLASTAIYFFAINAFVVFFIVIHSQFVEDSNNNEEKL
ncbi:hypothetical protein EBI_24329 [Enterocytozoon bieneusi H348]|nr:hypothetical protein EBI_24329 [Enterocytozoon bieneusi H348]|eukprot:XP_002649831.1 hypothetical protein EBI_24329 [Enterocytozoon bieneusi H348]